MTPHIEAEKGKIAKTVIMPGDPLRAKYIAENFLENYELVNSVRGIYAYTGTYNEKEITVMASGMGMPSIGIYSYELYKFYEVDEIIRVGSCGAYTDTINLYDVILVDESYTDSSFAKVQNGVDIDTLISDKDLNNKIINTALKNNIEIKVGKIHSSDVFYSDIDYTKLFNEKNCLAVEMESFALFHNAKILNKKATCLLTVSDNLITHEKISSEERQNSFNKMIKLGINGFGRIGRVI